MESHTSLITRSRQTYREAHERFVKRLRDAPEQAVQQKPADGGWSAAQIGWHVATVDGQFADLVSGSRPAQPLPDGAPEPSWAETVANIPSKLEAGKRVQPPPEVSRDEVLGLLAASFEKLDTALAGLDEARGSRHAITHPVIGTITLRQFGEWATAHTIRHNAQAKRTLGF